MTTDLVAVATTPRAATPIAVAESPGFDERWAAWQAKGAAHDRAFQRKMAIATPIVLLAAAVVMYVFLGR